MGDGFVVLQSSDIDIYYYQDEPGVFFHPYAHYNRYLYMHQR